MGTINQVFRRESYKKSVLHFFCAFQTSDGGMEKKRRMERAVGSGGFVGNGRNVLRAHLGEPDIPGAVRRRCGHTKTTKHGAEIRRRYKKPNIQVYMQKNDLLCN